MKEGYVIRDQNLPHFLTMTIVDWVDVFSRKIYKEVISESLNFCITNKGMILYGYVLMSNHIHLIIQSENGKLSDLIRDFKRHTSKSILFKIQSEPESRREWMLERFAYAASKHSRNEVFQVWQYGNHAVEIYSVDFFWSKLTYIHQNPVKAGIVCRAEDYIYSSAGYYVTGTGLIPIQLMDMPIRNVQQFANFNKFLRDE